MCTRQSSRVVLTTMTFTKIVLLWLQTSNVLVYVTSSSYVSARNVKDSRGEQFLRDWT